MQKDTHKTKVIFRTSRDRSREVLAIFPELPSDVQGYHCTFYAHIGQHGGGDRHGLIYSSRPALPSEAEALRKELESIGYQLDICQRVTPAMDAKRMAEARASRNVAERCTGCASMP